MANRIRNKRHHDRDRAERRLKYQRLSAKTSKTQETVECPTPGKYPFASRKAAKIAKRNTQADHGRLAIYKCICGAHHLGTNTVTREQARAAWT